MFQITKRAFTITELLVVLSLIVLIIAVVLAGIGKLGGMSRTVRCGANQKQIALGISLYTSDYNGHVFAWRNWGKWLDPSDPTQIIDPTHNNAYWGVMYAVYADGGPELFHCPESIRVDPDVADLEALEGKPCNCYGINGYAIWQSDTFRQENFGNKDWIALYKRQGSIWVGRSIYHTKSPAGTLFCHDAYETMLDGNGDTLDDWYQYEDYGMDARTGEQIKNDEYLRHGGKCNCLWFDGHVSSEGEEDWRREWYLGTRITPLNP